MIGNRSRPTAAAQTGPFGYGRVSGSKSLYSTDLARVEIIRPVLRGVMSVSYTHLDVYKRQHLAQHKGFTSTAKDWKMIHSESFSSKKEAMSREKEIKSWKSKIKIEALVKGSID